MNRTYRFQAVLAAALLALTAVAGRADHGSKSDQKNETRLRARLTGPAIQGISPEGNADFRSEAGRTRLQVEVEHVNLPAGAVLVVFLQSGAGAPQKVGALTLSSTGFGELELDSQEGAVVPTVNLGDVLSISHAGVTIMAGAFGPA